jgi:hypothetical protein
MHRHQRRYLHLPDCPTGRGDEKIYQGPINPRTGQRIYAGRPLGSEVNQFGPVTIKAASRPNTAAPYWVFGTDFDWRTYDFDRDVDEIDEAMAARLNANAADLEQFRSHGGKLILWHGFPSTVGAHTLNALVPGNCANSEPILLGESNCSCAAALIEKGTATVVAATPARKARLACDTELSLLWRVMASFFQSRQILGGFEPRIAPSSGLGNCK